MAAMSALPGLELCCFGAPTARLEGRTAPTGVLWRKHLALLVYLACSPDRARTRDHLTGLLWPEKAEAQARHSLNEAVRRLRAHLGAGRLVTRGASIALTDADLEVDALRFEALAHRDPSAAVALLRGDFLEGFALDDAPAFEEWAETERQRYRVKGAAALLAAGEAALVRSDFPAAKEAALRTLALQPYDQSAARLLIRAAALSGDATGALAAYGEFAERLRSETGEQPGRELVALAERVRSGRARRPLGPAVVDEPPLVGRAELYREAFGVVADALPAGPRVLAITGDPGMGKTRLVSECLQRMALESAVTAVARPLESDQDAPWSTLRAVLRAGLLGAPGSAAAEPTALATLSSLSLERDRGEVAAACAALMRAVADEQPVGLAVDDAQWSDGASVETLGEALAELPALPVLLLVASTTADEYAPPALARLHARIGRGSRGAAVHLGALSERDLAALLATQAPWCRAPDERDRLARRLAFESGGSPFLALTILRALESAAALQEDALQWPPPGLTMDSPLPIGIPGLARRAIIARVAELDEEGRDLLRAASVGALAIDPDLVVAVSGLTRARIDQRLPALERHRLLAFDGTRYVFAAPLIAKVVREDCLRPGQRQTYRARAMAALAQREDPESRVLHAELRAKVEPGRAAFEEAIAVARDAAGAGMARTARRALLAAERSLAAPGEADRRALDEVRGLVAR